MSALLSIEQHVAALAANLPSGRVWVPKMLRGSNLNGLLRGLAPTFERIDAALQRFVAQSIPTTTEDYLAEWEAALGIPDPCVPLETDTAKRQRNIEIKLAIMGGVQTKADFEFLASLFGLVVSVNAGIDHVSIADGGYGTQTPVLDIPADFATLAVARASIVVVETLPDNVLFPYDFPIPFTTGEQLQLRCLFETLKQANGQIVYVTGP
jgi:uncharacterized protein YmfQ (DUF2313 family)